MASSRRRTWGMVGVVLACCTLGLAKEDAQRGGEHAEELFAPHRLWEAHIRVSAEAWKRMQVVRRESFAPPPAPKEPQTQPADYQVMRAGFFGHQYTYVRGTLEFGGKSYENVGIRFKGVSSYDATKMSLKRPFKIDFDRFEEGKRFYGLEEINLQNNACDASQIRDALSYWAFREAGIVAPRTTFVLLYLSIEGERERVCVGLYTLVEEVDRHFLKAHFGSKQGQLVKPESGNLPYRGDDWSKYSSNFQPRKGGGAAEQARLMELARIIHQEKDGAFREKLEQVMDVKQYLRYLAINVMIADLDGPLGINHNFILFSPPEGGKVVWIPWDMNMAWGDYQRMGGWDELVDLSIDRPWIRNKVLLEKVLAVPEWRAFYRQELGRLMQTSLSLEKVRAEAEQMEAVVREADRRGGGAIRDGNPLDLPWTPSWRKPPPPQVFAQGRWESIRRQLEGRPSGQRYGSFVPRYRMGGMHEGPSFRKPAPLAPTKRVFAAMDADHNGKLSEAEVEEAILPVLFGGKGEAAIDEARVAAAIAALKQRIGPNPALKDLPPQHRGDQPMTPQGTIIFEADRDLDGKVVREEVRATIRRLMYEYDLDDDGQLDQQEFANAALRFLAGW